MGIMTTLPKATSKNGRSNMVSSLYGFIAIWASSPFKRFELIVDFLFICI